MKEWLVGAICAIVIMAACAVPWGRMGGSPATSASSTSEGASSGASAPPPSQPTPPPDVDPEVILQRVIERTNGDYTKTTADERSHLNGFTQGHGREYFEKKAREWKQKSPSARPSNTDRPKGAEGQSGTTH
jgi:hypothetical protein